ncbi:hypothetical protein J6590_038303 [Homalodisca vitripennis]|nr:hypothetical protein J6590_038303 [Homalodisca vitripennis]
MPVISTRPSSSSQLLRSMIGRVELQTQREVSREVSAERHSLDNLCNLSRSV